MILIKDILFIAQGLSLTLILTIGGISIGLILGTLLAIFYYTPYVKFASQRFISITRGTPLILQLSFFYFALPPLIGVQLSVFSAGIITFGLNSAAYIAEILRSGIESLPVGQFEAAQTLRIPKWLMWKDLIMPQVIKNVFPALINELIALLKETALISTIGGMDIMRHAQSIAALKFSYFAPLVIAGIYYYSLVLLIETVSNKFSIKNLAFTLPNKYNKKAGALC